MLYVITVAGILLVRYLLAQLGAHIVFRPQKKRWPLRLPFKRVHCGPCVGVYLPAKDSKPTLLFFHGRGGNISHFESFAQAYAPLGYGIVMFDYRGFGLSKGTPSQNHFCQDSLAIVQYTLDELHIPPAQLVIYGHSLGNAPALFAVHTLKDIPFKALILQSPFLSTPDMAASWAVHAYRPQTMLYRLIRAFVTPFLWFNRFNNVPLARNLHLPVCMCTSKEDATLPWQQSAKLADSVPHIQRFLSATGGHDEFNWAVNAVDTFLDAH